MSLLLSENRSKGYASKAKGGDYELLEMSDNAGQPAQGGPSRQAVSPFRWFDGFGRAERYLCIHRRNHPRPKLKAMVEVHLNKHPMYSTLLG
jgi:hypothetical protein